MCLAIPGQVEQLFQKDNLKMAKVNFGGIKQNVCIEYTPNVEVSEFVLVHVGFALSIIDEAEAKRSYEALSLSGELNEFTESIASSGKVGVLDEVS
jgi:hydrogenase expression/formation protein HypC